MHECCGNEDRERTFGQIFNTFLSGSSSDPASSYDETKTIIYQSLFVLAFFILIAYSFLREGRREPSEGEVAAKKRD